LWGWASVSDAQPFVIYSTCGDTPLPGVLIMLHSLPFLRPLCSGLTIPVLPS